MYDALIAEVWDPLLRHSILDLRFQLRVLWPFHLLLAELLACGTALLFLLFLVATRLRTTYCKRYPYLYHALPTTQSIRLLKLAKDANARLHIELSTHALDACPIYTALSYSWDSAIDPGYGAVAEEPWLLLVQRMISVDGRYIPVAKNLYDFLASMSRKLKAGDAIQLWIDALCIDQENLTEKSAQIELMADVYSKAEQVIIWLGSSEDSVESVRWMHSTFRRAVVAAAQCSSISAVCKYGIFEHGLYETLGNGIDVVLLRDHLIAYLTFLASRRWFTRAWVVQEVTLASRAIMLCGDETAMPWTELTGLSMLLGSTTWIQEVTGVRFHLRSDYEQRARNVMRFMLFRQRQEQFVEISKSIAQARPGVEGECLDTENYTECLIESFYWTRSLQSSRPEDRLFALLPMARKLLNPGVQPLLHPDCSAPSSDVFMNMSRVFIQHGPRLVSLSVAGLINRTTSLDLPTWAIDPSPRRRWSTSLSFFPHEDLHTVAPRLHGAARIVSITERTLTVKGRLIDHVAWMRPLGESALQASSHECTPLEFIEFCQKFLRSNTMSGDAWVHKLWRTMIFDKISFLDLVGPETAYIRPPDEFVKEFTDALESNLAEQIIHEPSVVQRIAHTLHSLSSTAGATIFPPIDSVMKMSSLGQAMTASIVADDVRSGTHSVEKVLYHGLRFSALLRQTARRRGLFVTNGGYFGMGPICAVPGDAVFSLAGATSPYILRKSLTSDQYQLVGDAYLHEYKDGGLRTGEDSDFSHVEII